MPMHAASPTIAPYTLLMRAAGFAARAHTTQRRKGEPGEPYINHPIRVAEILTEAGVTDVVALCAALLHDTVEDTEATTATLRELFGPEVASVVAEVTDPMELPKLEQKRLQVERAQALSPRARLVRLADKIANVDDMHRAPPRWKLERRRFYLEWASLVVDEIRGTHAALEARFDAVLAEARAAIG